MNARGLRYTCYHILSVSVLLPLRMIMLLTLMWSNRYYLYEFFSFTLGLLQVFVMMQTLKYTFSVVVEGVSWRIGSTTANVV